MSGGMRTAVRSRRRPRLWPGKPCSARAVKRADAGGGSPEGRARLPCGCVWEKRRLMRRVGPGCVGGCLVGGRPRLLPCGQTAAPVVPPGAQRAADRRSSRSCVVSRPRSRRFSRMPALSGARKYFRVSSAPANSLSPWERPAQRAASTGLIWVWGRPGCPAPWVCPAQKRCERSISALKCAGRE